MVIEREPDFRSPDSGGTENIPTGTIGGVIRVRAKGLAGACNKACSSLEERFAGFKEQYHRAVYDKMV